MSSPQIFLLIDYPSLINYKEESSITEDEAPLWHPVVHPGTGKTYYWNSVTNETTPLGFPDPNTDTIVLAEPAHSTSRENICPYERRASTGAPLQSEYHEVGSPTTTVRLSQTRPIHHEFIPAINQRIAPPKGGSPIKQCLKEPVLAKLRKRYVNEKVRSLILLTISLFSTE